MERLTSSEDELLQARREGLVGLGVAGSGEGNDTSGNEGKSGTLGGSNSNQLISVFLNLEVRVLEVLKLLHGSGHC